MLPKSIVDVVVSPEAVTVLSGKSKSKFTEVRVPYDGEVPLVQNQGVVLSGTNLMARYDARSNELVRLNDLGLSQQPNSKEMRLYYDLLRNTRIKVVTAVGAAGTGKTSSAIEFGLAAIFSDEFRTKDFDPDVLTIIKPAVEVGKSLGFLPGGLDAKLDPYMASYEDAISKYTQHSLESLQHDRHIEILVSQYARGRDLGKRMIIIDEAQGFTNAELGTIISRFHSNCKVIVCGDLQQCDVPKMTLESNGLWNLIQTCHGSEEYGDMFGFVELKKNLRGKISQIGVALARKGSVLLLPSE